MLPSVQDLIQESNLILPISFENLFLTRPASQLFSYDWKISNSISSCKQPINNRNAKKLAAEKARIETRLNGFSPQGSPAWKGLTSLYGKSISQTFLVQLACQISLKLNIPLDRDAKRRKKVLIKWFDEHWIEVLPLLPIIKTQLA